MRKLSVLSVCGLAVLGSTALSMSALPQDPVPARTALKYGDRCRPLVGKMFFLMPEHPFAVESSKGPYKLVAVGTDFVEFESEKEHVLMPLSTLRLTLGQ